MTCTAILLAAGSATRMNGANKQLLCLGGVPVLIRAALAFEKCAEIAEIVISAREADREEITALCREYGITKLTKLIAGGATRAESAARAFREIGEGAEFVAIHDGARPFVTSELIRAVIRAAEETGAAIPALAVKDTIKRAENGTVAETPDRAALYAAQTPQVFRRSLYEKMLTLGDGAVTDDSALAERLGVKVKLAEGDPRNIKLTTPDDLTVGEALLPPKKEQEQQKKKPPLRIGHGYDVHRLVARRRLVLGGVAIPYERGLLGHSDADVLAHAVMDALLGALALGDIGKHFPDTDPAYEGADSLALLRRVAALVRAEGYRLSNLDATVSAEQPKLAPHIAEMRENLAAACGVSPDRVSVKATTEEGLGLKGEGIGATCVCLLEAEESQ
ncbi:MAG: 2-C-methyl-D-erythritol 2,4-cyclodiphosphate synthase [Eubacterium sp.]|nr:2-C-methyl-D-erythritol 2,4-cyclodiphosphate synthase [Eubacterium sp.]MCM1417602.1 2-C-methyl-D-erythritol 2,4-cyclodiphosphate synthase [Roseburia sp.]